VESTTQPRVGSIAAVDWPSSEARQLMQTTYAVAVMQTAKMSWVAAPPQRVALAAAVGLARTLAETVSWAAVAIL